jgi:hypothetical protein
LTCDFWAEFEEKKLRAEAKAIESVASPSALLQPFDDAQGRAVAPLARGFDAGLEPGSNPKAER